MSAASGETPSPLKSIESHAGTLMMSEIVMDQPCNVPDSVPVSSPIMRIQSRWRYAIEACERGEIRAIRGRDGRSGPTVE